MSKLGCTPIWQVLLLSILLVPPCVRAELQNVIVNGFYSLPEEDRYVRIVSLPQDEHGVSLPLTVETMQLVLLPGGHSKVAYVGGFNGVRVPITPSPRQYPNYGRVALSFYYGIPGWSDSTPREGDLIVEINGHQEFSTTLNEGGWHPRLVSLHLWAGRTVSITFRGAWMEGDPIPVVIAMPRIAAWHGPYYAGMGGLTMVGRHGGRAVPVREELRKDSWWELGVDGTLVSGGPLLVEWFDVYRPAKLKLQSATYNYVASLREGGYWLPLPLAAENEPGVDVCALEGVVESGAVDIIPNFMANDAEHLREIEAYLAQQIAKDTSSNDPNEAP